MSLLKRAVRPLLPAALCSLFMLTACSADSLATGGGPDGYWPQRIVIISVADENNPDAVAGDENNRLAMEEFLGVQVEMFHDAIYAIGIEALRAGNLDVMLVTPMSFFLAQQMANIEPLVYIYVEEADPYKTVFITHADRHDINSISDLRGRTFAFVDPASSSGYMYPKAHLVTHYGLNPDNILNSGYFFEHVAFSGRHDASLIGVSMGDFDAAAVAYVMLGMLDEGGLVNRDAIKIIGETPIIPPPLYIVRADLPQSLKDAILEFYLTFDDPHYFEHRHGNPYARYTRAHEEDYDVIADLIRALNLEIVN